MSRTTNMFAVLGDSDDEKVAPTPVPKKNTKKSSSGSNNSKPVASNSSNVSKSNSNGGGRGSRGDRNTKGGRGPRTARDGKRTYDRRSGTGRGKEIKKGGGGSRNWGSDKAEAKKAEGRVEGNNNRSKKSSKGENEVTTGDDSEGQTAPPVVVEEEEEEPTISLDEYFATKKEVTLFGPKAVKVVENEFEGKSAHKAVEGDFLVMGSGKTLRKKSAKKDTEKIDINFRFKKEGGGDGRSGREGRGDDRRGGDRRGGGRRSGGRGGGDRRGGRGRGRGSGSGFALDSNAFPSL
jgi:plasminogen activator inhibitor 1 RNA-binding protein